MNLVRRIKHEARGLKDVWTAIPNSNRKLFKVDQDLENLSILLGGLHVARVKQIGKIDSLREVEFKVFSQFGQDGILQYLINHIPMPNKLFIEFGVQTYFESTTRFLLMHDRWSGLVMDGDKGFIDFLNSTTIYWQYDLTAKHAFITKENINQLISDYTTEEDIGVLVIDIDGNDYWVWQALTVIKPRIVVCEYNSLFGSKKSLTVPYDPEFVNPDFMHFGASLKALTGLADKKGYALVGCNSAGNDAFFVRRDLLKAPLKEVTVQQAFTRTKFRGSTYNDKNEWKNTKPLFNIATGKLV